MEGTCWRRRRRRRRSRDGIKDIYIFQSQCLDDDASEDAFVVVKGVDA
jgi:hypothetical protein